MARIAINGLGRIGKLVLRDLIDNGAGGDIVLLNEPNADVEQLALLMEFDSVHGRWGKNISWQDGFLIFNGQKITMLRWILFVRHHFSLTQPPTHRINGSLQTF